MESFTEFVAGGLRGKEREPFCPFGTSGYCDIAFSNHCYNCDDAKEAYEWFKLDDLLNTMREVYGPLNP